MFKLKKGTWDQLATELLQLQDDSLTNTENLVYNAKQNLRSVFIEVFLITLVLVAVSIGIMYLRFRVFGR
jgi:hypothetical protein